MQFNGPPGAGAGSIPSTFTPSVPTTTVAAAAATTTTVTTVTTATSGAAAASGGPSVKFNPYLSSNNPYLSSSATEEFEGTSSRKQRDLHFLRKGELTRKAKREKLSITRPASSNNNNNGGKFFESASNNNNNNNNIAPMDGNDDKKVLMEWWDLPYLSPDLAVLVDSCMSIEKVPYDKLSLANQKSSLYVEHPVPIPGTKETAAQLQNVPLKLYQTKEERKRIRRQRREIKNQEIRDKIAIGLMQAPGPRIKASNLLRIRGDEHALEPSAVEAQMREQVQSREEQHVAKNLANKLTPAERQKKLVKKIEADNKKGAQHVLLKISNLYTPKGLQNVRKGKILLTAKRWAISGKLLIGKSSEDEEEEDEGKKPTAAPSLFTVLLAEGGPNNIRRFVRSVLKMNWSADTLHEYQKQKAKAGKEQEEEEEEEEEEDDDDDEEQEEATTTTSKQESVKRKFQRGGKSNCWLVWKGIAEKREFQDFSAMYLNSESLMKDFFLNRNLASYWDSVKNLDVENYNIRSVAEI